VHTAAIEVGQGMVTVVQQVARSVLGIEQVAVLFDDTSKIGSAGSTSASRQTQMAGGAVFRAASTVRQAALGRVGGDEFAIMFHNTPIRTATAICRGIVEAQPMGLAPRVKKIDGLRLAILDNSKWNCNKMLRGVRDELQKKYKLAAVNYFTKDSFSSNASPEQISEIVANHDIALTAIGD